MKIIYLYNQLGAGPMMISSLLINSLNAHEDDENIVVVNDKVRVDKKLKNLYVLPTHNNIIVRLIYRFIIEFIFVPGVKLSRAP